nr:hypothetical protein [Tanacetum cinerariifolium]
MWLAKKMLPELSFFKPHGEESVLIETPEVVEQEVTDGDKVASENLEKENKALDTSKISEPSNTMKSGSEDVNVVVMEEGRRANVEVPLYNALDGNRSPVLEDENLDIKTDSEEDPNRLIRQVDAYSEYAEIGAPVFRAMQSYRALCGIIPSSQEVCKRLHSGVSESSEALYVVLYKVRILAERGLLLHQWFV